ncbi:hypothetical protein, partial [uncultured Porphyromonas sp.]|uniref:hypothetical protein n=1 Tax=uncultured Porphyromonas sp. TaxID=159274 RepID=UPI0026163F81
MTQRTPSDSTLIVLPYRAQWGGKPSDTSVFSTPKCNLGRGWSGLTHYNNDLIDLSTPRWS